MVVRYQNGGRYFLTNLFKMRGSVFPSSFFIAVPCAFLAGVLKMDIFDEFRKQSQILDNGAWSSFSFLVGFLIVFRTSNAYNRFWHGASATHQLRAEWFDAASSLVAFCKAATADPHAVGRFQNKIVRLFSMLHSAALSTIDETGHVGTDCNVFQLEVIDAEGLDKSSIMAIRDSEEKCHLIFQWIQQLCIEESLTGVLAVAPPVLSRAFQELANGMVAFHDAQKITYCPFPFPYAQICGFLLVIHWALTPIVIAQYTASVWCAVCFTFVSVFILWALNNIAVEIENPYGKDANDLDFETMQQEMNRLLLVLISPTSVNTPELMPGCEDLSSFDGCTGGIRHGPDPDRSHVRTRSLGAIWHEAKEKEKRERADDEVSQSSSFTSAMGHSSPTSFHQVSTTAMAAARHARERMMAAKEFARSTSHDSDASHSQPTPTTGLAHPSHWMDSLNSRGSVESVKTVKTNESPNVAVEFGPPSLVASCTNDFDVLVPLEEVPTPLATPRASARVGEEQPLQQPAPATADHDPELEHVADPPESSSREERQGRISSSRRRPSPLTSPRFKAVSRSLASVCHMGRSKTDGHKKVSPSTATHSQPSQPIPPPPPPSVVAVPSNGSFTESHWNDPPGRFSQIDSGIPPVLQVPSLTRDDSDPPPVTGSKTMPHINLLSVKAAVAAAGEDRESTDSDLDPESGMQLNFEPSLIPDRSTTLPTRRAISRSRSPEAAQASSSRKAEGDIEEALAANLLLGMKLAQAEHYQQVSRSESFESRRFAPLGPRLRGCSPNVRTTAAMDV